MAILNLPFFYLDVNLQALQNIQNFLIIIMIVAVVIAVVVIVDLNTNYDPLRIIPWLFSQKILGHKIQQKF